MVVMPGLKCVIISALTSSWRPVTNGVSRTSGISQCLHQWFGWWDKGCAPCSKFQTMERENDWPQVTKLQPRRTLRKMKTVPRTSWNSAGRSVRFCAWGEITPHVNTGWELNGWDFIKGCQNVYGGNNLPSLQVMQTAHGVISGEADSGKLWPPLFIPAGTSFGPTRMSRTIKSQQRAAKIVMVGQMIFKEKVGELSLFVLQEETQGWSSSNLHLCERKLEGWWRQTLFGCGREYNVATDTNHGLEAEIHLMFKTVTKS